MICGLLWPRWTAARMQYQTGRFRICFLDDFAGAEQHYREAILLDPKFPDPHNDLGRVLELTRHPSRRVRLL